VVEY